MCEKRTRKIKKGSNVMRLREARRMQRLQRLGSPPAPEPRPCQSVDKAAQGRVLLELAWKTVALMHKNKIIQQKIVALQKETSEFVASVMSNPENQKRYLEHLRIHGITRPAQTSQTTQHPNNLPMKVQPDNLPIKVQPDNLPIKVQPDNLPIKVQPKA